MKIYEIETNYKAGRVNDIQRLHVLASDSEKAIRKAVKIARRADPSRTYDAVKLMLIGTQDK